MTASTERAGRFMVEHPWLVTMPLALLTAISLLVAGVAYFGQQAVDDRVTVIEQSPCVKDPASKECNLIRRKLALHEPIQTLCISFQRALPPQILDYTRCVLPQNQRFPPNIPGDG